MHFAPVKPGGLSSDKPDWSYIVAIAREHRPELLRANLIAIFATAVAVPVPLLMPLLVDEVLLERPGRIVAAMDRVFPAAWHGPVLYILVILMVTVLLRMLALALNVWQTRELTQIAKDITCRIRARLLAHLKGVSMAEYETLGGGAVSARLVTDVNTVDEFLGASISRLLVAVLMLVGVSAVLLWMHWPLALFILLLNPVVIFFTVALGKKVKSLKARENRAVESFQEALTETLDAIRQIRASGREGRYLERLLGHVRNVRTHAATFSWRSDASNRLSMGVFLVGFDVFRALTMLMVVFSDLSIGQMLAVFAYLWFMMAPVQEILNIQYAFYAARAALGRLDELLALKPEPRYPHRRDPFAGKDTVSVRVEDVHFAYGAGEPVLKGVSLDIGRGEKVALVGASGGGKSTLVQVLIGMYPAQRGQLYYDEVPVTDIGLDVVRANVATVLQHPAMLNDTVRANLTLGHEFNDAAIRRALEIAQLRGAVEALPLGLETPIGRQGVRLSGGQLQRLAIARMVLTEPKVVILDEATSALDNETETRVHRALSEFLHGRTTLIIAHRLSAVRQANRVYVFEDGHIAEQGSHEELIRANGLYRKLYADAKAAH
jgi:ATP-binding cassette subfamily C protein